MADRETPVFDVEHLDVKPGDRLLVRLPEAITADAIEQIAEQFKKIENGVEEGGVFLVGWRGALYTIYSDFQVGRSVRGENAVGSGGELARGALFVAKGEPRSRVKRALEAASVFNAGVAPPFKIILGGKPS
ncbi:MAG TPA: hypothetical protein VGK43_00305 [Solirubrobacterales bacterium]